jgi:hypothetical protein
MSRSTFWTVLLMVVVPGALIFVAALQGGTAAVPFNAAATVLLMVGTAVYLLMDARQG